MTEAEAAAQIAHILASPGDARSHTRDIARVLLLSAPPSLHDHPEVAAHVVHAIASLIVSEKPVELAVSDILRGGRGGLARLAQGAEELILKGLYAVNAVVRIAKASDKAQALRAESGYHAQQLQASEKRQEASRLVDEAAKIHGDTLGWFSQRVPGVTEPECWDAHGSNFSATRRPARGWPGSVHGHCKCKAVGPWLDGKTLE